MNKTKKLAEQLYIEPFTGWLGRALPGKLISEMGAPVLSTLTSTLDTFILFANKMKVSRVLVRVLKTGAPISEINFPGNARPNHPVKGSIYSCSANFLVLFTNQIKKFIGAQVAT